VQVVLEGGEPRLGALDPGLRGPGRVDADFGQALGLLAQLACRFLVQEANRGPLATDGALEPLEAPGGIALKPRLDVVSSR